LFEKKVAKHKDMNSNMMEDFLRILKQQNGEVTTFSEKIWCGLMDYATAYAAGRLTFTFKNGSAFEG
jgi:hypothetical protein